MARMTASMAHRGPDGHGVFCDEEAGVCLGHRRLSIVDLSEAGLQPMTDASGRFYITFNGEIYNYREFRAELESIGYRFFSGTDTEVILAAFRQWGLACLERFRGMFAFALLDRGEAYGPGPVNADELPRPPYLLLARDRLGIKPLIWTQTPRGMAFASELRGLKAGGFVGSMADPVAILECLAFGAVKQPRTIHPGAFHLPPAHAMLVWEGGLRTRSFQVPGTS